MKNGEETDWNSLSPEEQSAWLVDYVTDRLTYERHQVLAKAALQDSALFARLGDLTPLRLQVREVIRQQFDAEDAVETTDAQPWWRTLFSWQPLAAAAASAVLCVAVWNGWSKRNTGESRVAEVNRTTQGIELNKYDKVALNFRHPDSSLANTSTSGGSLHACVIESGTTVIDRVQPDVDGAVRLVVPSRLLAEQAPVTIDCGGGKLSLSDLNFDVSRTFR